MLEETGAIKYFLTALLTLCVSSGARYARYLYQR
jgi:hypothetical protein